MRSRWTVFQILLMSAVICVLNIVHGNEIIQYLKNYKATKTTKTILESTYKVVVGT